MVNSSAGPTPMEGRPGDCLDSDQGLTVRFSWSDDGSA